MKASRSWRRSVRSDWRSVRDNALFIHVTLVPYLRGSDEHKSKPTQHSVKNLQGLGIKPDIIVLRADEPLEESIFKKIALFCNVKPDCVIENITIPVLYEAPLMLEAHHFSDIVCRELGIEAPAPDLADWKALIDKIHSAERSVTIGLVGKYVQLHDAYLSVAEALRHAGYAYGANIEIEWIDSESLNEQTVENLLSQCDGMIVPGGFGNRGIEGKIADRRLLPDDTMYRIWASAWACRLRSSTSPDMSAAWRTRIPENLTSCSQYKVIDFLPDQSASDRQGRHAASGRLSLQDHGPGTQMYRCYGTDEICGAPSPPLRVQQRYIGKLWRTGGLVISGTSPDGNIVETVEIPQNDFYIGVQFHPEFKSRPNKPHPLFLGLIEAALTKKETNHA